MALFTIDRLTTTKNDVFSEEVVEFRSSGFVGREPRVTLKRAATAIYLELDDPTYYDVGQAKQIAQELLALCEREEKEKR